MSKFEKIAENKRAKQEEKEEKEERGGSYREARTQEMGLRIN